MFIWGNVPFRHSHSTVAKPENPSTSWLLVRLVQSRVAISGKAGFEGGSQLVASRWLQKR